MREQITTVVVVTLLTLIVWLFAEIASLGEDRLNGRLSFAGTDTLLVTTPDFDGDITLDVRGSRGAIDRARNELDSTVRLAVGAPGVPDVAGDHTVRLLDAVAAFPAVAQSGVLIESVRPQRVQLRIDELVDTELPVTAAVDPGVEATDVTLTPPTLPLRLPRSVLVRLEQANNALPKAAQAIVPLNAVENPTESGPREVAVDAVLPQWLARTPGVELRAKRVRVSFQLTDTREQRTFRSVPVQVLLTPEEAQRWDVEIAADSRLLAVTITGPSETLERLESGELRLIAALALSDLELGRGGSEKRVSLLVLDEGVPSPLPAELRVDTALPTVLFEATRAGGDTP